jgi:hypothetical protein
LPTFNDDTVHGLTADVYFNDTPVRTVGEQTLNITQERLPLTANDEGMVNPVADLRRGDMTTITVGVADAYGLATLSGVILGFASGVTSGPTSGAIVLPKAAPGDNFLNIAGELRLVMRDGSSTWVFEQAAAVEIGELTLSEEEQTVWPVTFQAYRFTHSGVETPFYVLSGSHPPS